VRDRLLPQIVAEGTWTNELDLVNFETGDHITGDDLVPPRRGSPDDGEP
jgi:hypothetical protein